MIGAAPASGPEPSAGRRQDDLPTHAVGEARDLPGGAGASTGRVDREVALLADAVAALLPTDAVGGAGAAPAPASVPTEARVEDRPPAATGAPWGELLSHAVDVVRDGWGTLGAAVAGGGTPTAPTSPWGRRRPGERGAGHGGTRRAGTDMTWVAGMPAGEHIRPVRVRVPVVDATDAPGDGAPPAPPDTTD